jgi:hypothetical protein
MNTSAIRSVPVIAILALLSAGVLAKGKPQPEPGTNSTLTFDDLSSDAIQSDGLGAYEASLDSGVITLSTGKKRALWFDFSDCLTHPNCDSPFGASTTGSPPNVTVTVDLLLGSAIIEFSGGGDYLVSVTGLTIREFDDDSDGATDRYAIESGGVAQHALFLYSKRGGRGMQPGTGRYWWQGDFSMPWGIEVVVD